MIAEIEAEMERAEKRYGPFASAHEGLGVLIEECDELRDAIRANDLESVKREAIQVAAVAARIAESLGFDETRRRSVP